MRSALRLILLTACILVPLGVLNPAPAVGGETFAQVKSRGAVLCGVSEGIVGFSAKDASGSWSGLNVDFCRAVAAAALGDAARLWNR